MSKPDSLRKFSNVYKKLKEKRVTVIWQGGKFDTLFIEYKYNIRLPIGEDVMLMGTAYDLDSEHGLKRMAQRYLGVPDWDISKKDKLSGKKEVVLPYLKLDVKYTWELFCYFINNLEQLQVKVYRRLLLPAYRAYRDIERNGIHVNKQALKTVQKKFKQIESEKLAVLNSKYEINWNSADQLQKVLFKSEGLPILKKSAKTGKPSADKKVLNRLAYKGYKLPIQILEYKEYSTLNKMFLNRWDKDIAPDGRMHPNFGLTNVRTGRTSCSNPNLQQVPRNTSVRSVFTAPDGFTFFEADYSQLELRIAADYANEPTMINIYNSGGDIHTETARIMTNGRDPTHDERGKAKAINFGFIYGMLAKGFVAYAFDSYNQIFSIQEATRFREMFFAKYRNLLPWHEEMAYRCELMGGVANRFGRFRKLPDIYSDKKFERLSAMRKAINTPVQGTGSDLLISSATELNRLYKHEGLTIAGTVHDSILGWFKSEDEEFMVPEIKRIMAHPSIMDEFDVSFKVPLEADVGLGPWGSK